MRDRRLVRITSSLLVTSLLSGCFIGHDKLSYLGNKDLEHYRHEATRIDYSDVGPASPDEALVTDPPRTVLERQNDGIWDLSLTEALHLALANNRVIRSDGQFLAAGSTLFSNPDRMPSIYDPAIQESGVLFGGGRGIEAALADFDAELTTSMTWGRDELLQNNGFFGGVPGGTFVEETGEFRSAIEKTFATGGSFTVAHDWDYSATNVAAQLFPSVYQGNFRTEFRQPLWAGSGTEFTRIAGPTQGAAFGAITGVGQGVVIARINNDITLADFELSVRNLLRDVENLYWELYLRYRLYDTAVTARNSSLRTWREQKAKLDIGGAGDFKPADEAQARDQYFKTRADVETTLGDIYSSEVRLRRLLGLPVNDGRVIRPANDPTAAQLIPDWHLCLTEALTRRAELRRHKWNIKSLELQLSAAESLTNPQLDFVSAYRVNALGDHLLGQNDNDRRTAQGLNSAYETLTQGDQTGWNMGFVLSMPLGFRQANAQVRNFELRLAKAREVLSVQEMEISHELATAVQSLATQYATAQSNLNRQRAAIRRVELFEAELRAGTVTADPVLRAQTSLAEAERAYHTSLVRYNQAITDLHFRKGTLLDHNNVHLAEGEWTSAAYRDSLRKAWARTYAFNNYHQWTEPKEFVLPDGTVQMELAPVPFSTDESELDGTEETAPAPVPADPENSDRKSTSDEASQSQAGHDVPLFDPHAVDDADASF